MKKIKVFAIIMIMVMALTGSTPSNVEAKTKASITVTNKSTGKKVGKKVTLKKGKNVQLKVKYGKKVVTKKAKYKTSDKTIATVTKKGKITAKSAGTCTVKVTYKKAVKKIKVTVKANETTETTTEATTEAEKPKKKKGYASDEEIVQHRAEIIENQQTDPTPSCNHEWRAARYVTDVDSNLARADHWGFVDGWQDHFYLDAICCKKCNTYATTNRIPYLEAEKYTSDDFAKVILCYDSIHISTADLKHKHKVEYGWLPPSYPGDCWFGDDRCAICGNQLNDN